MFYGEKTAVTVTNAIKLEGKPGVNRATRSAEDTLSQILLRHSAALDCMVVRKVGSAENSNSLARGLLCRRIFQIANPFRKSMLTRERAPHSCGNAAPKRCPPERESHQKPRNFFHCGGRRPEWLSPFK